MPSANVQSYLGCTDMFCGAGGSSQGAASAGAEIALALNHSKLAIETHAANFPQAKHDCCDVSATDPRRYPRTTILLASPECDWHTGAQGAKRYMYEENIFGEKMDSSAAERSRATAWDVVRFSERHDYRIVIVENVWEFRKWRLFDSWLTAMHNLDYEHKEVYANSLIAHPCPQSRDRLYAVFWKRGQRAPDLDIRPAAPCLACGVTVEAVQRFKNPGKPYGRFGKTNQYLYICPTCGSSVYPYYYPAYSAIDFGLPAPLIGSRSKPLATKTMERIRAGLKKFSDSHVILETRQSNDTNNHLYPVAWCLPTQTSSQSAAMLAVPFRGMPATATPIVDPRIVMARTHHGHNNVQEPLSTIVSSGNHHGLLLPFVTTQRTPRGDAGVMSHSIGQPIATMTGNDTNSVIVPAAMIASYYRTDKTSPSASPLPTVTTLASQAVVQMPFIGELHGGSDARASTDPLGTLVSSGSRHALVETPVPMLVGQYNGPSRNPQHTVGEPLNTLSTVTMHSLIERRQTVEPEECGFRMLQPSEIKRGMAFADSYIVHGNKREQVEQLGNAVTPPIMKILVERCIASLE